MKKNCTFKTSYIFSILKIITYRESGLPVMACAVSGVTSTLFAPADLVPQGQVFMFDFSRILESFTETQTF